MHASVRKQKPPTLTKEARSAAVGAAGGSGQNIHTLSLHGRRDFAVAPIEVRPCVYIVWLLGAYVHFFALSPPILPLPLPVLLLLLLHLRNRNYLELQLHLYHDQQRYGKGPQANILE